MTRKISRGLGWGWGAASLLASLVGFTTEDTEVGARRVTEEFGMTVKSGLRPRKHDATSGSGSHLGGEEGTAGQERYNYHHDSILPASKYKVDRLKSPF